MKIAGSPYLMATRLSHEDPQFYLPVLQQVWPLTSLTYNGYLTLCHHVVHVKVRVSIINQDNVRTGSLP